MELISIWTAKALRCQDLWKLHFANFESECLLSNCD